MSKTRDEDAIKDMFLDSLEQSEGRKFRVVDKDLPNKTGDKN